MFNAGSLRHPPRPSSQRVETLLSQIGSFLSVLGVYESQEEPLGWEALDRSGIVQTG